MKKNFNIIIIISIFLITITSYIVFSVYYNNIFKNENIITSNINKDNNTNNMISYMLEGETAGIYSEITTNAWPDSSSYTFNSTLSRCEKGSKITWNSSTNKAEAFINGTDNCYIYFDKFDYCTVNTCYYWNAGFDNKYYSYPLGQTSTNNSTWTSGNPSPLYNSLNELQSGYAQFSSRPYYIKTSSRNELCMYGNDNEFCLGGNYWDTDAATTKTKLQSELSTVMTVDSCYTYDDSVSCRQLGGIQCSVYKNGNVYCNRASGYTIGCEINSNGSARCVYER